MVYFNGGFYLGEIEASVAAGAPFFALKLHFKA
jgi:hypothetical protein